MSSFSEITVKVNSSYSQLHNDLTNQGFIISDQFEMVDIYMIPTDIDIYTSCNTSILSKSIIIREKIGHNKEILIKEKQFDNENIIRERKITCPILDVNDAVMLFEQLGYKRLFIINDFVTIYNDSKSELIVQCVNNEDIYIEIEEQAFSIPIKYESIDEMKAVLQSYKINYNDDNYFVQKASIELEKTKSAQNAKKT